jgi:hypothetical protein
MDSERDRSWFALLEVAAAAGLIATMFLPWFLVTPSTPDRIPTGPAYSVSLGGVGGGGLTDADLVVWFGPPLVLVLALLAAVLPWRGFLVATLIAFLSTGCVGALGMIHEANFDELNAYPTRPYVGLELFAVLCLVGTLVAAIDLTRGGTSTALWRRLRAPSIRRYGPFTGYVLLVLVSLLIALFPMSAQWTWLVFAAMLVGLAWWARALRTG